MAKLYEECVFINCPFTDDYAPIFNAILFTVVNCGYTPRSALEVLDAGQYRLQKIEQIIAESQFGIHDISNMELDPVSQLPRFNMPFELGLFMGAIKYGSAKQKRKKTAIFDKERFRFQKSISDISGQDIQSHNGDPNEAIRCVRKWLNSHRKAGQAGLPGAKYIQNRYAKYEIDLPNICQVLKYDYDDLDFIDRWQTQTSWVVSNP